MALVSESMNRSLAMVSPDASMAEAARVVQRTGAEHVLVVDEETLVGILCACELRGAPPDGRVSERMSGTVATVRPDVGLEEAAAQLVSSILGCLPVALGDISFYKSSTVTGRARVELSAWSADHAPVAALPAAKASRYYRNVTFLTFFGPFRFSNLDEESLPGDEP